MYLGTQFAARTDADYETFKQLGVNNINGFPDVQHQNWTPKNLIQYREKVESFGLKLDMVQLPLSSADIDTRVKNGEFYNILTGTSPERDYEIERICEIISMCSEAGIPAVKYNLNIIGIPSVYSKTGFFQVTNVEHSVNQMVWTTSIEGQYRSGATTEAGADSEE